MLERLNKIIQYQDITVVKDFSCPLDCCGSFSSTKPILLGYCDTDQGIMLVFECPVCHLKFRWHCGDKPMDLNAVEEALPFWMNNSSQIKFKQ